MVLPISLRVNIAQLLRQGHTQLTVAKTCGVSLSSVRRIRDLDKSDTLYEPPATRVRTEMFQRLSKHIVNVLEGNTECRTVQELQNALRLAGLKVPSGSTLRAYLKRLNYSFKLGEKRWYECSAVRVAEYWTFFATKIRPYHNISDLFFLDETSFDPHEPHPKAWRPKGSCRTHLVSGKAYGKRISVCAVLGSGGIIHRRLTTGTYDGDSFMSTLHVICQKISLSCW